MSQCHDIYGTDTHTVEEDHLIHVHLIRGDKTIQASATMNEGLVHLAGYGEADHILGSDHAGSAIARALTSLAAKLRALH
jgi:hypothetical protein